jgi:hypothetical protein
MMPIINWSLIAPEVIVCAAAVLVMLVDAFVRPTQRWITGGFRSSDRRGRGQHCLALVHGTPRPMPSTA